MLALAIGCQRSTAGYLLLALDDGNYSVVFLVDDLLLAIYCEPSITGYLLL